MVKQNRSETVCTLVLAAGSASRFGSVKQLEVFAGRTLAERAVRLAEQCSGSRSILVAGHEWPAVVAACAPLSGFVAINDRYEDGIASSVVAGVRAVQHVAGAVIVLLADQPLVTPAHLAALVAAWSGAETEIVASSYAGTTGVPALFARGAFDRLLALRGDQGARALFDDARFEVRTVAFADAAVDIDTPADLSALQRSARS